MSKVSVLSDILIDADELIHAMDNVLCAYRLNRRQNESALIKLATKADTIAKIRGAIAATEDEQ